MSHARTDLGGRISDDVVDARSVESLKVMSAGHARCEPGQQRGPVRLGRAGVDIYDVSVDCRYPQLLATVDVGLPQRYHRCGTYQAVVGHEGSWAPDGLTYYGGDLTNRQYYAVDTTIPTEPKLIATWLPGPNVPPIPAGGIALITHGMSISDDGIEAILFRLPRFRQQPSGESECVGGQRTADLRHKRNPGTKATRGSD